MKFSRKKRLRSYRQREVVNMFIVYAHTCVHVSYINVIHWEFTQIES